MKKLSPLWRPPAEPGQECLDQHHGALSALGAYPHIDPGEAEQHLFPSFRGGMLVLFLLRYTQEVSALCNELLPVPIAQEAIVSDLRKSVGKDVQQKPSDELIGVEGHQFRSVFLFRITIAEGDSFVVQFDEAIIGNGHPMGVSAEIVEDLLWISERFLAVDHPFLLVEIGEESLKVISFLKMRYRAGECQFP